MADVEEFRGLSAVQAADRLRLEGLNQLRATHRRTFWSGLLDVVREPMTALLLGCGALYLLIGDRQEALMLMGFVVFVAGMTLYQERKSERAMDALRDLASPRALVIRDGQRQRIPGRDVVREDLVVLGEGDRVPADGVIVSTTHCSVDESLLTGEAMPVAKVARPEADAHDAAARPGGEGLPFVYAGTLVVQGAAIARVTAIGPHTEMGRIGVVLDVTRDEQTRLQRETRSLVWKLALVAGALCVLVVTVYGLTRHDWLRAVLAGLTLAMAILPNEFPVVVTIFLALGAWRLSRSRVLTRRIPAVEALGAVTVLCVDKTGTLTQNRMTVSRLASGDASLDLERTPPEGLPAALHATVEFAVLASRKDPYDPMELAFKQLAEQRLAGSDHVHPDFVLEREYPLARERLAMLQVWRTPAGEQVVACKGAPESVARLCRLDGAASQRVTQAARAMAADGLRVLAVARGALAADAPPPDDPSALALSLVGLVGLSDPLRPTARPAIEECHAAGVRVVMISGDYPETAGSVARQAGLLGEGQVMTGAELEELDDEALRVRVGQVNVFARVMPEQKLRIVEALKATGEVVAMTGDGVNDAPALKAAHIGIAMGARGTDVAREAAQLVLLDDDFAAVALAVRTGRRIHDNLEKALTYILAVHLPILGLTVVPIVAGWPLVLMPIHVAFLQLVIDPACSLVFEAEPEEANVMRRPPRPADERLFSRRLLLVSLAQGLAVTAIVLGAFAVAYYGGRGEAEARAVTFTILILSNLALIFANRSARPRAPGARARNPALWWVTGGTVAFLAATLYVPPLRGLFRFALLHSTDIGLCLGGAALGATFFAGVKRLRARLTRSATLVSASAT